MRAKRKATLPNNVDTETLVMPYFLRDGGTGRAGMLPSRGSQRVRHDLAAE